MSSEKKTEFGDRYAFVNSLWKIRSGEKVTDEFRKQFHFFGDESRNLVILACWRHPPYAFEFHFSNKSHRQQMFENNVQISERGKWIWDFFLKKVLSFLKIKEKIKPEHSIWKKLDRYFVMMLRNASAGALCVKDCNKVMGWFLKSHGALLSDRYCRGEGEDYIKEKGRLSSLVNSEEDDDIYYSFLIEMGVPRVPLEKERKFFERILLKKHFPPLINNIICEYC